jgi:catechol 2,3-dioxygenase-like lactoylglutathione lyase family enzyme
MNRVTVCRVFVHDQDKALDFYTKKLGFQVAEDARLGEYRWLLVMPRAPVGPRRPDSRMIGVAGEHYVAAYRLHHQSSGRATTLAARRC